MNSNINIIVRVSTGGIREKVVDIYLSDLDWVSNLEEGCTSKDGSLNEGTRGGEEKNLNEGTRGGREEGRGGEEEMGEKRTRGGREGNFTAQEKNITQKNWKSDVMHH